MKNPIPAKDAAIVRRAQRLLFTTQSDGWQDVLKILNAIVDDALAEMKKYKGMDDHQTAVLTFIWKTAYTQKENLLATIDSQIDEGGKLLQHYQNKNQPTQPQPAGDGPLLSATLVIPVCDMETTTNARPEESDEPE